MSTIMVVDDMAICREPIAEALRQNGYDTICAENGAQALSLLLEKLPDLVLLDVNMPEMDGLAVLRTIRRNSNLKQLPVILLTDLSERETITQAAERGVQGYLLKSQFSFEELLTRVEACLINVPVATVTNPDSQTQEASGSYQSWRSSIEIGAPVASPATRSAKPTTTVKHGQPTNSLTSASGQGKPAVATLSVNDLAPVITKDDLIKLVNDGLALRPLGPTVHNVIAVTGSAGCCADDVAKVVSHDQALCIRLLKLANSSAYSRGHLVDSIKEAVQRIGVQEVRSLVMTLGVFEQFEGAVAEHVDSHLFWEHSIGCGLAASAVAEARHSKNTDDCFLWGMLHDVGRLILIGHVSDQYAEVWDAAEKLGVPLESVEAKMMLLDHCDILERALEHWQFPRDFIAPVVNHHRSAAKIKRLGPALSEATATVALANRITHALLIGSSGNEVIYPLDDLVETLKLSPSDISSIVTKMPDETNSLKNMMLARTNEDAWPNFASQIESRLDVEFRPMCISAEPEVDAYRIFCERLANAKFDEKPNVGIMYLREAAQLPALAAVFDSEELKHELTGLPVIFICGKGQLEVSSGWVQARRHVLLKTPVPITHFLTAIEEMLPSD